MKKQSRGILFLWALIAAAVAGGTFLVCKHLGAGSGAGTGTAAQSTMNADVSQDTSASDTATATVAVQAFSNDGYAFSVPASWNIERTGTATVAVHPDADSSAAACKIEVSAFPFTAGVDMADWISHRIGADPSLAVVEQSSEDVSFASGTGVKWIGTIDGAPTTLVYAFSDNHAYEIAPSVIGDATDNSGACDGMLETFLSTLKI